MGCDCSWLIAFEEKVIWPARALERETRRFACQHKGSRNSSLLRHLPSVLLGVYCLSSEQRINVAASAATFAPTYCLVSNEHF